MGSLTFLPLLSLARILDGAESLYWSIVHCEKDMGVCFV